jgi:hypothetical protein
MQPSVVGGGALVGPVTEADGARQDGGADDAAERRRAPVHLADGFVIRAANIGQRIFVRAEVGRVVGRLLLRGKWVLGLVVPRIEIRALHGGSSQWARR